jgi:1-acyl-sn-glycerol-3-phosphate acyltransferase
MPSIRGIEPLALLFLAGLVLAVLAGMRTRRLPLSPGQRVLYVLNQVLAKFLWRAKAMGRLPVPPGQGALIVSNHRSPTDPAFVYLTTNRLVHWMVAREYCEHPAVAWFFRLTEAIPVNRAGIDTAATKMAIRYLKQGELVGMFPEGRLNDTDELLLPGRPGAALVALKARVPVVPCYISGSRFCGSVWKSLFLPAKVRIYVGEPLDLSPYYGREHQREVLEEVTLLFLREISRLAGRLDYQPRLAGRAWLKEEKGRGDGGDGGRGTE